VLAILLIIVPLVPFVISQIQSLVSGFPFYLKQAAQTFGISIDPAQVQIYLAGELNSLSKNALIVTTKVFGGIFSLLAIFIVSFYLLLNYNEFKRLFSRLFTQETRPSILATLDAINYKLGAWLRGELMLMFFIGLMSWVALTILRVPYALPLALLAGILEVVPTLGPTLSAIPAVVVALTVSPTLAVTVILAYVVIQMVENNFLVPKVMEKAVGLNPVVIILGVMIGTNLMGIAGAFLAIPLISFILVVLKSLEQKEPR
jgi:predicted PurR-regulated permease PerM